MNKEKDMENKNKKGSLADRIPHQVWLLISFAAAMALCDLMMGRFGYLWARKEGPCVTV